MSYDIYLNDPKTTEVIIFDEKHHLIGGTYAVGGCEEAWLNITYNYASHFYRLIDKEKGIRFLYGKTGEESIPILNNAIEALNDDFTDDYREPTEGNAKKALQYLVAMAQMRPDGVWSGD